MSQYSSESIVKISTALLKAQKLMGAATKGASNPFFRSKYADYGSVLEACKDHLNDNGVLILQPHYTGDKGTFVVTKLVHAESGEWVSSETEVVVAKQSDPQAFGSALTYSRRYSLQSLLALPAEDDDGEKNYSRTPKTNQTSGYMQTAAAQAAHSQINQQQLSGLSVNNSAPAAPVQTAGVATTTTTTKSSFKKPRGAAKPANADLGTPSVSEGSGDWA